MEKKQSNRANGLFFFCSAKIDILLIGNSTSGTEQMGLLTNQKRRKLLIILGLILKKYLYICLTRAQVQLLQFKLRPFCFRLHYLLRFVNYMTCCLVRPLDISLSCSQSLSTLCSGRFAFLPEGKPFPFSLNIIVIDLIVRFLNEEVTSW